ncbi:hypothetical protein GOODEAATRI_004593 [Goodea atripinnis]|uniref:Uncharacterized protein n=1 Tax=Goodea atripinnis TaxID=208336 RepID=A0ABV0MZK3_9TELE
MDANCQERYLETEDPCHLLFQPASLFWLLDCQSPLPTTSHTEKQMSACHFSRHLTLKCSPFCPSLKGREASSAVAMAFISSCMSRSSLCFKIKPVVKQLTLELIIAVVRPATISLRVALVNVSRSRFSASDFSAVEVKLIAVCF